MRTSNLRINQLDPATSAWYVDEYLAAMDALDVERYLAFLADDAVMHFNADEPIRGKAAIGAMLSGYWQTVAGIEHDLLNIYGTERNFMLEADNHYARHDGRKVTTRAVAMTDRDEAGKVVAVRIVADTSKLFTD